MSLKLLNRARGEIEELRLLLSAEALARAAGNAKFRASLRSKADNVMSAVNQSDGSIEAFDYIEYTDDAYYRLLTVTMVLKHPTVPSDDYGRIKEQLDMAMEDIGEALKIAGAKGKTASP